MSAPLLIRNARLLPGFAAWVPEEPVDVLVGSRIAVIEPTGVGRFGQADEIDAGGRWIMPGLWDEHVHFDQWAMSRARIDLSAATTARKAAVMLAEAARAALADGSTDVFLVARDYRDAMWPDQPTATLLDEVMGDARSVPVVAVSGDLHSCWVNTAALRLLGRDVPGATGYLVEQDCFDVVSRLDSSQAERLDSLARTAAEQAATRGIVGVVDMEMQWDPERWVRRTGSAPWPTRVLAAVYPDLIPDASDRGLATGAPIAERVSVGYAKIITDGSLNTRTAYCVDPYRSESGDELGYGALTVEPQRLDELLAHAARAGLVPAVHAIGDEANRLALDAFAASGLSGRIEHAQLLRREDIARFAALGITASVQPVHALDDRDVADHHWHGRTDRAFVLRDLVSAGATVVLGSDAPVAPLDPWVSIEAAVRRTRGAREPWHGEQALTRAEALRSSVRSRLAVGEPGDVVVLDADPHTVTDAELSTIPVALTVVDGSVTHRAL